jgi:hypothetical protein
MRNQNRCPRASRVGAGDGMTEPPTSCPDLAAPRCARRAAATKVSIFDKLSAASRTQAVAHARRLGLIA